MMERMNDMAKAAGMCPHGNFPSSCAQCPKEGDTRETAQRIEAYVVERLQREVSPERKAELSGELAAVSDVFDAAGIDAYVAGGTGIDLLDGEWDRDHQDLDMAIMGNERRTFFDAATRSGFRIVDPYGNPLDVDAVIDPTTHNAFASRTNEQGTTRFEVIFLNQPIEGRVALNDTYSVDAARYAQAPRVTMAGREVAIQPPEIILFHKLTDGRRKDFRDAKKVWDTLSEVQRGSVDGFLADTGVVFTVDGEEIRSVRALFDAAESVDAERHRGFFGERVPAMEEKVSEGLMAACGELFARKERAADPETFSSLVGEMRTGVDPERGDALDAMAQALSEDPTMTLDRFKAWAKSHVRLDARLGATALREYVSEQLWETTFEKESTGH
jgi:hypothetical protein